MKIMNAIVLAFIFTVNIFSHDKWIVVTTINYPTNALKQLSQLDDWRMVVVADKKTPHDWYLEGCDFLSVEKQESLGFSITKLLPWNHYSRKNIGYLYAIKQGAQIICEMDDDNYLLFDSIEHLPEYIDGQQCRSDSGFLNPYALFGQPSVWPRGYPLQRILMQESYIFLKVNSLRVPIQQGLVNKDPDVDAIFRLTRPEEIYFDSTKKSISLAPQTMTPYNSQNTVFHYSAFWALIMPITTAFRVSDIWRSFWTQRLLWDMGGHLCFLWPTAIQYRNDHNLLNDFIDENDVYTKSEDLMNFLREWKSDKNNLSDRIIELMDDLIKEEFFGSDESRLIKAWLYDLENCDYQMPSMK